MADHFDITTQPAVASVHDFVLARANMILRIRCCLQRPYSHRFLKKVLNQKLALHNHGYILRDIKHTCTKSDKKIAELFKLRSSTQQLPAIQVCILRSPRPKLTFATITGWKVSTHRSHRKGLLNCRDTLTTSQRLTTGPGQPVTRACGGTGGSLPVGGALSHPPNFNLKLNHWHPHKGGCSQSRDLIR